MLSIKTIESMRVSGRMTNVTVEVLKYSPMEILTKVPTMKASLKDEEFTPGQTGKFMTVNGKLEQKMDTEFGKAHRETHT